jgi:peptidoglycan/LPS O-acetylase OafA/YrhL
LRGDPWEKGWLVFYRETLARVRRAWHDRRFIPIGGMNPPALAARVPGLDTLRALAIALVVLHHYTLFVSGADTFGPLGQIGWVGVDLFFALSGYLIGNQIFTALRGDGGFSLTRFYARRLLRTLPAYYAVLALYFLWPAFRTGLALPPLWKFISFTQNIALNPGTAFSHAWSLCIEEQFYLLLPGAALLIAARRHPLRWAWAVIGMVILAGMLVRAWLWRTGLAQPAQALHNYYQSIYYASWCRLDELVVGVALALLKNHHRASWRRITARAELTLGGGALVTALACSLFLRDHFGFGVTVFGYPLLALGFGLLIVAALSAGSPLHRWRVPGASSLALWSYAIYLSHKPVCILAARAGRAAGHDPQSAPVIASLLALSVLAGWLLYRLVEAPCMALRVRIAPDRGGRPAPLAALAPTLR